MAPIDVLSEDFISILTHHNPKSSPNPFEKMIGYLYTGKYVDDVPLQVLHCLMTMDRLKVIPAGYRGYIDQMSKRALRNAGFEIEFI